MTDQYETDKKTLDLQELKRLAKNATPESGACFNAATVLELIKQIEQLQDELQLQQWHFGWKIPLGGYR